MVGVGPLIGGRRPPQPPGGRLPAGRGLWLAGGGRGGGGGPQAGPSGRTAPAGEARRPPAKPGRLRPVARLMLKCAEGQGIVTGK